jgi:putative FmdB family regulatory protein
MATYDYRCKTCETIFSISGSYSTLFGCHPACPCCRSENVNKIYGNISVIYKAKGFYATDNKKKENNNEKST